MIRYAISQSDLEAQVDAAVPTWRTRAATRTAKFITLGKYEEASDIWSEVKPVFMAVQHDKCAYCERQLASADSGGAVEHDLEHFRPKSLVKVWPGGSAFSFPTGTASPAGYFWLAYHLLNYSVACKKCNTGLKLNYFPVPGSRGTVSASPADLAEVEKPFLVYPIGELDDDPAEVITFEGLNAIPVKKTGPRKRRADVTIQFFRLNIREELLRERARLLDSLGLHLETINDPAAPPNRVTTAKKTVERMLRPSAEHSACVSAMTRLYVDDVTQARALIDAARAYLDSLG
jgi:hypothetical protein